MAVLENAPACLVQRLCRGLSKTPPAEQHMGRGDGRSDLLEGNDPSDLPLVQDRECPAPLGDPIP